MNKVSIRLGGWWMCALALVFITLRLTGHIDWSWWWVLAPLWAIPALMLAGVAALGLAGAVVHAWGRRHTRGGR